MPVSDFGQGRPKRARRAGQPDRRYREKPVANAEGLCHDRRHAEIRESAGSTAESAGEVRRRARRQGFLGRSDGARSETVGTDRKHPQECDRPGNPRKGREGPERRDHEKSGRTAFLAQRRTLIPADERDAGSRPLCRRNPHDRVPVRIVQCPDDQSGR